MPNSFPAPGEWPCHRLNGAQDARCRLKGDIVRPRLAWKHYVGAVDSWIVAHPGSNATTLRVPGQPGPETAPSLDPRWGLAYPAEELAGRLQPVAHDTLTTYARVLPGESGLQRLEFESGFNKPTVNGNWDRSVGRCFAWRNGAWVKVWETEPIDMLFHPYPIVGDFDRDGEPEVAILPWYELLVFDARTGKVKDRCRFTEGRSYGFFGVYDLDGDGLSEFLVQADFSKHVDVLGYRDGRLVLLWQREIESDITNPQKILRVNPCPAADTDGDGRIEVLISLYNDSGDRRWHLTVCDGMSGAVKAELTDVYLQGIADLNGDGAAELMTVATDGGRVPEYGRIRVHSLRGGRHSILWERDHAAWETWERPLPRKVNSAAAFGRTDVLWRAAGGRSWAVFSEPAGRQAGDVRLSVLEWDGQPLEARPRAWGRQLRALALDADGNLLLRATAPPGRRTTVVASGPAEVVAVRHRGVPPAPVAVAWEKGREHAVVIAQGPYGDQELVTFRPPSGRRPARELKRLPGRGQSVGWPSLCFGPVVADLAGDGRRQILFSTSAPDGTARMVAADLDGRELWHADFPAIPGKPGVFSNGAVILWQVGHFTDPRRLDVLVTIRRTNMHSEETLLLSGRDGRELWHRDRQISARGVGGTPFAIADLDGDGLDDAASLHPSVLYILKGSTGRDVLAKDASWPGLPASLVYWGIPIAGDFDGTGRPSLFFGTDRRSMVGLVRTDGSLAWWEAFDRSTTCLPAFGDFEGTSRMQAVGVGFDDGIRCYDTATGEVRWRLPSPAPGVPAGTASGDVNGDGRDEALLTLGQTLYCVGTDGPGQPGRLLWKVDLPAALGPPAIADVEGRGKASILVVGADGYVYCIQGEAASGDQH